MIDYDPLGHSIVWRELFCRHSWEKIISTVFLFVFSRLDVAANHSYGGMEEDVFEQTVNNVFF